MACEADDPVEVKELMSEIDERSRSPSVFNLSRDHAPIAVLLNENCVVSTLHFRQLSDDRLKREAFRQAVYYIDVETSSQCNRKCLYCPNSQNDRFTSNKFMDDSVYKALIDDLHEIDFARELHFVGYSEPLLYVDDLLGRIDYARKKLAKAQLIAFTNGDYIEKETVAQLIAVGCDEIRISVHLPPGKPYTDDAIFARINKIAARLATPIRPIKYIKDTHIFARLVHPGVTINIYQTDYERFGSNRASTLEGIGPKIDIRTAACLMPIYQFVVGHKGAVVPCCVMVSDDPRNAKYLVGHVTGRANIFDVYCGPEFVEWRRGLFNLAPKASPCDKCSWDGASSLLNEPGLYDPWQSLVSPARVRPVVVG